jgi:hypothetical protein
VERLRRLPNQRLQKKCGGDHRTDAQLAKRP